MAMANLTDDELVVDSVLGYPRGYEKLCRQASTALTRPAFHQGPPHSFHPYSIPEHEAARMEELESLFPVVEEQEGINARINHHTEDLWNQLDHLGNAGFDPALFRVDIYGNVIYWKAHEGSPLAWSIDHWFPRSRGGKSVPSNLRLVQWQVQQKKGNKLEFLVPWWDMQIGVSVIAFLSVFSSPNADFRHKSFSLFFANGRKEKIDEKTMADCHSWPKSFLERVNEMGLLSASVVAVEKMRDRDFLKNIDISNNHNGNPGRRRWNIDEEETIRRPLIKCTGSMLSNRETKDKLYRSLQDESKHDKENRIPKDKHSASISVAIEKEERIKISQEEQKKEKEAMIVELENQIHDLKMGNEKDKSMLEEFERVLAKQRMKLDKQRKWSDSQSRYRICLEKMFRDTMQQCITYKEQARRNQDACTALVARLESQRKICDVAEEEAEENLKQRKLLEAMARPKISKRSRDAWDTDLHSWMDLNISYDAEFIKDHQGLVKGTDCEEESVGENVKSRNRESYLFEDEMESRSEIKKAMQAAMAEAIKEDEDEEVEGTEERSIQKVGEKFNFENWFQVLLQNPEEMERCHTENPEDMKSSDHDHEFLAKRGNIVNGVHKKLSCSQDQESDKMRGMVVPFATRKAETLKPVNGNVVILGGGCSEELMRKRMDQGKKINTDIVGDKAGSHDREEPAHRRQPQQRLAQNLAIKFETQSPTTYGQYSSSSPATTSDTRSSNSASHYEVITANKLKSGNNNNNTNSGPKSPSLCRTGGECRRTTPLQKQRPVSCERSIVPTTSAMKPHGAALLHNQPTRQQQIQRQESSVAAILSRQRSVGSGGGGGAARKADMLMKSASTRGNSSNSRTGTWTTLDSLSSSSLSFTTTAATISTSTSSEPVQQSPPTIARAMGRRCNSTSGESHGLIISSAGVAPPPPQVKKHLMAGVPVQARRKHSNFFQDLDSSISHVWKKAVKKFDLSRQHQ